MASGYGNMKTAICEMSNTTGVLSAPISGTINLDQEVGVAIFAYSK